MRGMHGIAGPSPHGIMRPRGVDGRIIGANPQNAQSSFGVDGTTLGAVGTGALSLRTNQRSTQSMLGGATRGEEEKVHLTGSLTDGVQMHGLIMMHGRVMDGLRLQVLTAA